MVYTIAVLSRALSESESETKLEVSANHTRALNEYERSGVRI